mgnify:CR=1 FL=1
MMIQEEVREEGEEEMGVMGRRGREAWGGVFFSSQPRENQDLAAQAAYVQNKRSSDQKVAFNSIAHPAIHGGAFAPT